MSTDVRTGMYRDTQTWSPFKGCSFDCTYCEPTFKRQSRRQECPGCKAYVPHYHPDRLKTIPSKKIVFACGNSDVVFCRPSFMREILARIKKHRPTKHTGKTFYFQSKQPEYFEWFLGEFPENVILLTTLETNRDEGYESVSKAPLPSERYRQFLSLDYSRKVVTIEPVMDFDHNVFIEWITDIAPEYVWIGFNSKPESVSIPEPSEEKLEFFMRALLERSIEVRGKELRGIRLLESMR